MKQLGEWEISMNRVGQSVALGFCGLGVGWLAGMSASPVVGTILAAVLGLVVPLIAALAGLEMPVDGNLILPKGLKVPLPRPSMLPITSFILSICLGSTIGLIARSYEVFGPHPAQIVDKWAEATGLPKEEVGRKILDGRNMSGNGVGVLFAGLETNECDELSVAADKDLHRLMSTSTNAHVREFAKRCKNTETLRTVVETLLCPVIDD